MSDESAKEKAMRSIFGTYSTTIFLSLCVCVCFSPLPIIVIFICSAVANIAFETTEDQLKSVLSEVGPVVNLK